MASGPVPVVAAVVAGHSGPHSGTGLGDAGPWSMHLLAFQPRELQFIPWIRSSINPSPAQARGHSAEDGGRGPRAHVSAQHPVCRWGVCAFGWGKQGGWEMLCRRRELAAEATRAPHALTSD